MWSRSVFSKWLAYAGELSRKRQFLIVHGSPASELSHDPEPSLPPPPLRKESSSKCMASLRFLAASALRVHLGLATLRVRPARLRIFARTQHTVLRTLSAGRAQRAVLSVRHCVATTLRRTQPARKTTLREQR